MGGRCALPEYRSGIPPVDTAAFGGLVMGMSNMFFYGGTNRNHCGFEPHARALRTMEDGYRPAGYEIPMARLAHDIGEPW